MAGKGDDGLATDHPDGGTRRTPSLATWAGFAAMCIGMFMAVLDVQIVATSLPTIQAELGIRPDQMSWVQTSYLIAEVVAIPLTGLLTRALSPCAGCSAAAIAVFTLASAGCAYERRSSTALIAWRVLQGFAGGMLIPQVFAAGFALFPGRGQALATTIAGVLAVLAPTSARSSAAGSPTPISWHWLFLVNILPGDPRGRRGAVLSCRAAGACARLLRKLDVLAAAAAWRSRWPPGNRPEGSAGARLAVVAGRWRCMAIALSAAMAVRGRSLLRPKPYRRPARFRGPQFRARLRAELRARHRPLRHGLSDAGVPRLRRGARCARDRPDHDRHRAGAARSWRRSSVWLEQRVRRQAAHGGRLSPCSPSGWR